MNGMNACDRRETIGCIHATRVDARDEREYAVSLLRAVRVRSVDATRRGMRAQRMGTVPPPPRDARKPVLKK